ncbi:MFS transporter [Flexivirga alba]|uniref:MFS transporter n=1 Tax=Flexivirga alba TaxID=702742 RepID=A0ABW2AL74_9MICO
MVLLAVDLLVHGRGRRGRGGADRAAGARVACAAARHLRPRRSRTVRRRTRCAGLLDHRGADRGLGSARTVGGLVAGVFVLVVFAGWELRNSAPLLDVRLFARRGLTAGMLTVSSLFFVFFGFIFVFMQYLQFVRGWSPLVSACAAAPVAVGLLPAARLAPYLVERVGVRILCGTGMTLVALAMAGLATAGAETHYWVIALLLWVGGTGMGWGMTPATASITDALPEAEQGVASAMNDVAREVGGALGIAVLGSVLSGGYRSALDLPPGSERIAGAARESVGVATQIGGPVRDAARDAFVSGLGHTFVLAAVIMVVCAVGVVTVLGARRKPVTSPRMSLVGRR